MTRERDYIEEHEELSAEQERIRREVIIMSEEEAEADAAEHNDDDEREVAIDGGEEEDDVAIRREKPWMIFTTGSILTDGTKPYYRYFIAIALMCFLSILLTFMSLNADREYRIREKYASVLHERSVLKDEERYSLSSKSAVTKRLKEHGIVLIDLSKDSRLIEIENE